MTNNSHAPFEETSKHRFTNIWNPDCFTNKELSLTQRENNSLPTVRLLHSSQSKNANMIALFYSLKFFKNSQILLG